MERAGLPALFFVIIWKMLQVPFGNDSVFVSERCGGLSHDFQKGAVKAGK